MRIKGAFYGKDTNYWRRRSWDGGSGFSGRKNHQVHLFEKNEKLGKKLFITGKGRCNITNTCDDETFFKSVVTNAKFLYSAFYGYSNQDVVSFFENLGLAVKEERGGRIFPVSDHSSDVIRILEKRMKELDVKVHLKSEAETLLTEEGENGERKIKGIRLRNGAEILGEKVIVATGGFSYQATGSTGDGYTFAKEAGHTVTQLRPALVPIATKEEYVTQMQGLALKNIRFTVKDGKKSFI